MIDSPYKKIIPPRFFNWIGWSLLCILGWTFEVSAQQKTQSPPPLPSKQAKKNATDAPKNEKGQLEKQTVAKKSTQKNSLSWETPVRPNFAEDDPVQGKGSEWQLGFHGYARLPLMIADGIGGGRRPYLVDDQYFLSGFAYTRVSEREWVELFMSAQKGKTRIVAGLFTSELSDWVQDALPKGQKGIATAFVEHQWDPASWLKIEGRAGMFWERLGYIDAYDTYLFARTHIGGGRLTLTAADLFYLKMGYGAHQGDPTLQKGFSKMNWWVAGLKYKGIDSAFYYVSTRSEDGQYSTGSLSETLANEEVRIDAYGGDLFVSLPRFGQLQGGVVYVDALNSKFLGDAHELLHTSGGGNNGLAQRYLGENGTGELFSTYFQLDWNLQKTFQPSSSRWRKIIGNSHIKTYAMTTHAVNYSQSTQPDENFHDRLYFKWGANAQYRPNYSKLKGFFLGARFDRVVLDSDYEALAFRVWSPSIGWELQPGIDVFMSYAFYEYGDQIRLSSPQLRNESIPVAYQNFEGAPDETVFKLQVQARW